MTKQPIEFLFSLYRRKVLATLYLRPDERFHVRELERMTGISAGSLHRELRAMTDAGLLLREKLGNQVFYQVNRSCEIHDELASIFRKTMGLTDLLRDALQVIDDKIDAAFVFGSMASGKQHADSDLDICVIGDATLLDVVTALTPLGEELRRELNPVVMTADEFSQLVDKGDRFVSRLLQEPRLMITGDLNEFAEPA